MQSVTNNDSVDSSVNLLVPAGLSSSAASDSRFIPNMQMLRERLESVQHEAQLHYSKLVTAVDLTRVFGEKLRIVACNVDSAQLKSVANHNLPIPATLNEARETIAQQKVQFMGLFVVYVH